MYEAEMNAGGGSSRACITDSRVTSGSDSNCDWSNFQYLVNEEGGLIAGDRETATSGGSS